MGHILVIFGPVLGPSGPVKSTKNVERSFDFAFLRFSLRVVFGSRFGIWKLFGPKHGAKIDPKTTPKRSQNLKAILEAILAPKKPKSAEPGGMRGASRGGVGGVNSRPRSDVRFHTPLSPPEGGRAD